MKTTTKPLKGVELKNLIEQAESEIKSLLDSDLTSYEIGKRSGISNQVIDRYRKGTNAIENMTFKTAKKLLELIEEQKEMKKAELEANRGLYDFGVGAIEVEDFGDLNYFDTLAEAIDSTDFENERVYILHKSSGDLESVLDGGVLSSDVWYSYGVDISDVL